MPSADNISEGVNHMPQDYNDPLNNAENLDTRRDPTNYPTDKNEDNNTVARSVMIDGGPGFDGEERSRRGDNIPTIEEATNFRERFNSDHERLMGRIILGDTLINRENTHFGRFER
jgi:hypothetical protein